MLHRTIPVYAAPHKSQEDFVFADRAIPHPGVEFRQTRSYNQHSRALSAKGKPLGRRRLRFIVELLEIN
jgi:hypothetical protein